MVKVPDASAFPARAPLQGRGSVPAADGAAGGMMQAANLFGRTAQEQAAGTEALGQGLAKAGQIMFDAAYRDQQRHDAVSRANAQLAFQEAAESEFRRIQTEGDWSDQRTLSGYTKFLDERAAAVLTAHEGSADSRAALTENVLNIRHSLAQVAVSANMKAGSEVVSSALGRSLNDLRSQAYAAPENLTALFVASDARVKNFAAALTPEEERSFRDEGRAQIAETALTSMLDRGLVDDAEKIMLEAPSVREVLGMAAQSRLASRITQIRAQRSEMLKPFTVSPGGVVFDPNTKRPIYTAPDKPERPPLINPGNVIAPILGKMAAGDELTPAETKALDYYQKMDPLKAFMATVLGGGGGGAGEATGVTDEFSPANDATTPQASPPPVNEPGKAKQGAKKKSEAGTEGLTVNQQADLLGAQQAITRGADEAAVRSRIEQSGDPVLLHTFDRWNAIRKQVK